MFFGLTNSPATFQSFMNEILRELVYDGHVIVYLDDILIFAETKEHHDVLVRQVLEVLRRHKLYLKPEKCSFAQATVEYLGHVIGNGEVRMDPAKVEAVHDWPIPNDKREVQQFIGFCNYYRRFILGFSAIARPLHRLTGNVPWEGTEECTQAFETLKQRICDQPVLAVPDDEGQFRIEADSSNFANGAILSQLTNGKWHPIAFRSRSLTPTERNYEIYDKEMLAIMDSIDEWRQYLLGARQPFEVWTDHLNLQYFRKPQKLNYRQARWLTELQEYDFKLLHKPGSQMTKADLLSRRADHTRGENDNANVTLLKPELFLREIVVEALDKDFVERAIRARANKDRVVVKALAEGQEDWKTQTMG